MMFTTLSAKLAGMKAKVLAGTAVAGAALMLAAPAAHAQRVTWGVSIGTPVYAAPPVVYAGPGYYGGGYYVRDYDGWRARYSDRDHRFDRDDYYRRDFDRRDFDRDRHFDRDHDRDGRFDRR